MRKSTSNSSLVDRLTNEVQNGTVLARSYDALDRPTGYRLMQNGGASPPGEPFAVSYAYDALGRFSSVTAGRDALVASAPFTYSRLPGTDLVSGYASGNFSRSVAYEPRRDLIASVANSFNDSTPSTISTFAYFNDAAGRRVEVTRTGAAFGALSGAIDAYGYNARSEVVSARRTLGGDEVRGFGHDYAYDPIGNRTSATYYDEQGEAVASAYTANALN